MAVLETVVVSPPDNAADTISGVVVGLVLASLSWLLVGWLWYEMRFVAFVIVVLSWTFTTVGTAKLRRHKNLVRTSASGWQSIQVSDFRKHGVSLSESIWNDLALILWGAIGGFVVAGALGKMGLEFRWPIFLVVFLLWAAIVVNGAIASREQGRQDL